MSKRKIRKEGGQVGPDNNRGSGAQLRQARQKTQNSASTNTLGFGRILES